MLAPKQAASSFQESMDDPVNSNDASSIGETPDFGELYAELRSLAQRRLAQLPPGQTLQPTALVHEAWMRLAGRESVLPEGRRSLMFLVMRAMRDLLVEDARRKASLKRGGVRSRAPIEEIPISNDGDLEDVLAVHEALEALELESPESAKIVGLRYFAGLTVPETAEVMSCSVSTVERQWSYARSWLRRHMDGAEGPQES